MLEVSPHHRRAFSSRAFAPQTPQSRVVPPCVWIRESVVRVCPSVSVCLCPCAGVGWPSPRVMVRYVILSSYQSPSGLLCERIARVRIVSGLLCVDSLHLFAMVCVAECFVIVEEVLPKSPNVYWIYKCLQETCCVAWMWNENVQT